MQKLTIPNTDLAITRLGYGCGSFGGAWDRARAGTTHGGGGQGMRRTEEDPYAVLGLTREAGDEECRLTWRQLMRDNHPDTLAARGVPADFVQRASDKVARINAAWDIIKRERGL